MYIVTEQQAETYGALPGSEAEADRERSDSAGELTTKDNFKLVAQRIFSGGNSAELDRGESIDRSVLSLISSYLSYTFLCVLSSTAGYELPTIDCRKEAKASKY